MCASMAIWINIAVMFICDSNKCWVISNYGEDDAIQDLRERDSDMIQARLFNC